MELISSLILRGSGYPIHSKIVKTPFTELEQVMLDLSYVNGRNNPQEVGLLSAELKNGEQIHLDKFIYGSSHSVKIRLFDAFQLFKIIKDKGYDYQDIDFIHVRHTHPSESVYISRFFSKGDRRSSKEFNKFLNANPELRLGHKESIIYQSLTGPKIKTFQFD